MIDWAASINALAVMLALGGVGWLITLPGKNVNLVDSLWSLFLPGGCADPCANLEALDRAQSWSWSC